VNTSTGFWFSRNGGARRSAIEVLEPAGHPVRRQERRAATDDDRVAEHAQLVDEAELDRRRGQAGAADRDVLVSRVERRGGLLGHRRLGEPRVALDASSVRLKTTFGIAHQMSANATLSSATRNEGSVSHGSIVS
jgi:hypothetical protein